MSQQFSRGAITFVLVLILITLMLIGCTAPRVEVVETTMPTATSPPPLAATTEVSPTSPPVVTPPTSLSAMPLPVSEDVTFTVATQLGGTANAVALDGYIVYLGLGPRLVTVDIGDPAAPRLLWQSDVLSGVVHAVAVQDGLAYVGAGGDLYRYDIRDPANPVRIGTLHSFANPRQEWIDIILASDVVYTTSFVDGAYSSQHLMAFDVSDPVQPVVAGTRELSPYTTVTLSEGIFYIAGEGTLQLVDATNLDRTLSEIEIESSDDYGDGSYSVTVAGNLAYMGVGGQPLLYWTSAIRRSQKKSPPASLTSRWVSVR